MARCLNAARLFAADRDIGFITSGRITAVGTIAMGYLHRDFLTVGWGGSSRRRRRPLQIS
jgi:hypothetical protein